MTIKLWIVVIVMCIGWLGNAYDFLAGSPEKCQTPSQRRFVTLTSLVLQAFIIYAILEIRDGTN